MTASTEEYRALFTATLTMFSLNDKLAKGLKADHIEGLFSEVLEAYVSCGKIFKEQSPKPTSDHVPFKTVDV